MKKLLILLLTLILCCGCFTFTSCVDPLSAKIREMDETYVELGTAYYNAVKVCTFADVYPSDKDVNSKITAWKVVVRNAKIANAAYLDYDEDEMNDLIDEWKIAIDEINAFAAPYLEQYLAEAGDLLEDNEK